LAADRAALLTAYAKQDTSRLLLKTPKSGGDSDTTGDAAFLASRPVPTGFGSIDSTTAREYAAAERAYYDYHVSGLAHRRAVFEWQLFSSRVIFWIVIGLVAAGIAFSGIQFRVALEAARADRARAMEQLARSAALSTATDAVPASSRESAPLPASLGLDTSFQASANGIKLSSPVLGVIILGLSLLFFYLYLSFVYPIHESI
jgi:hypothetical protein